jgi:hypothetical protein
MSNNQNMSNQIINKKDFSYRIKCLDKNSNLVNKDVFHKTEYTEFFENPLKNIRKKQKISIKLNSENAILNENIEINLQENANSTRGQSHPPLIQSNFGSPNEILQSNQTSTNRIHLRTFKKSLNESDPYDLTVFNLYNVFL